MMEKSPQLKTEQAEPKMATIARFRKQVPTDIWSVRERLALACSVMRSGDQNWVSVSRAIKPFSEANRPNDWFSQKNCALQYSDLLEKVETPKRKRADRAETETPGDQIVRKLTIERIEELKRIVQEEQQKYKKLKREVEAVKAGQFDDKLGTIWQEMQQAKKAAHEAALAAQKRASEESAARAAAAAAKVPGKPVAVPNKLKRPQTGLKVKTSLDPDDMPTDAGPKMENIVKVEEGSSSSSQVLPVPGTTPAAATDTKPRATPPSSPLLSSLLQNKYELQKAMAAQQGPAAPTPILRPQPTPAATELVSTVPAPQVVTPSGSVQNEADLVTLPIPTIDIKEEIVICEPMDQDLALLIAGEEQIIVETLAASLREPVKLPTPTPSPAVSANTSPIARPVTPAAAPTPVTVKTEIISSPSVGAPTLSRLLVTPTSHAPLKLSTNQNASPAPSQKASTPTNTPSRGAKPAPAETKEVTPVSKTATPEPPPTPPTPTPITPKKEKPERHRSTSVEKEPSEASSDTIKMAPFMMADEEPCSPASSIVSNETDSGSGKGVRSAGRKGQRRGKGSRRVSQRITRGRVQEDEKTASSGKPSEAESSDEEGLQAESDDGTLSMTPKLNLSISESIPNSPASISQCDTEDEKVYKVWKKSIMLVWRAAANHKYANVFLHPVTNDMAPGYLNVVSRPMDLSMIKKNIELGALRTTAEFQRDMMLMFTNAIMYNNSDHDVYNMAVEMYNDVMVHIEQYVNTQMMVQSEGTKILRPSRRSEASMSDKVSEEDPKKRKPSTEADLHSTGGKKKRKSQI